MDLNTDSLIEWKLQLENSLPTLSEVLQSENVDAMIIGASCLEIYCSMGWMPSLSRQTGDLDIALILSAQTANKYERIKDALVESGYTNDTTIPYRLHAPKVIPGALTYIDLLVSPNNGLSEESAREIMGVGPGFTFTGFSYAEKYSERIFDRYLVPNLFGFVALKITSYLDEPIKRIKDLADIIETVSGFTKMGTHYEFQATYTRIQHESETQKVAQTLRRLHSNNDTTWDIENAQHELLSRNFNQDFIETEAHRLIKEFCDAL